MVARIRAFAAAHKMLAVLAVAAIAYGGYRAYSAATTEPALPTYTLAAVEKGTLISTVSGSGQVSASDQLDVRAKTSGEVTYVGVKEGQVVKKGTVLARLDAADAAKAVRDAQTALETAKLSLAKLQAPADALSMTQAQNSVASSERALTSAETALKQYEESAAQNAQTAYDDGFTAATDAHLDFSGYMEDLQHLRGSNALLDDYVPTYYHILGKSSPLVASWRQDHEAAMRAYEENISYLKAVQRTADDLTRYDLLQRTVKVAQAVSRALQSAHVMLDAIVAQSYVGQSVPQVVEQYAPIIEADISSSNGNLTAAQKAIDTIDTYVRDYPINLKQKQDAVVAARETLAERRGSLEELKAGADALDIRSAQISVQQKQDALNDAQRELGDTAIVAPFDGTVATFTLKRGDQLLSGASAAVLVTDQRFADITLNEVDVVRARAGQKVTITFDAIEDLSISGVVADVDVLGTVSQGVVNYGVRIQFDTQDERVRPGMSMSASVITDVQTDVLLVPSSAVKTSGDVSYVLLFPAHTEATQSLKTADVPEMRAVEVGGSNDSQTAIVSGLAEGEVIVIRTVAASTGSATASRQTGGSVIPGLGGAATGAVRIQGAGAGGTATFRAR